MVRILNPGGFAISWHKTPPRTLALPLKANPLCERLCFELGPEGPPPVARATDLRPHPGLAQAATLREGGLSYPLPQLQAALQLHHPWTPDDQRRRKGCRPLGAGCVDREWSMAGGQDPPRTGGTMVDVRHSHHGNLLASPGPPHLCSGHIFPSRTLFLRWSSGCGHRRVFPTLCSVR